MSATNKVTFQKTVNLPVLLPAVSVKGPLQKKNLRPSHAKIEIKSVNSALSVNQCLFAPNVINVPCVVKDPPVGGRLQLFWQVWLALGSNPRVVSILREGYQLGGKSFGFVGIDIECKNISISGDIGGFILSTK